MTQIFFLQTTSNTDLCKFRCQKKDKKKTTLYINTILKCDCGDKKWVYIYV